MSMPKGPVLYSYLSVPGATASEIRTEVLHAAVPFTPDAVCVVATSNNLTQGTFPDACRDFTALLATVCSRWPKVCLSAADLIKFHHMTFIITFFCQEYVLEILLSFLLLFEVFVLDFPTRLKVEPDLQAAMRREFHRVAAGMGMFIFYL